MPQKYLIRFIGTKDYYSVFAPCGTTKEYAARLSKEDAESIVNRSIARNGKAHVEIVKEGKYE